MLSFEFYTLALINVNLNFCRWYEVGLQFHSFAYRQPTVPTPFVEKTILPLAFLIKIDKTVILYYFDKQKSYWFIQNKIFK